MIDRQSHDFFTPWPDRGLVAVARGAMGDFLNAWPALAALADAAPPGGLVLDAREGHRPWTDPLGFALPDPAVVRGLMELHKGGPWPEGLKGRKVLVFGLAGASPFAGHPENLAYVSGLDRQGFQTPRERYAKAVSLMGAAVPEDWRQRFSRLFGPVEGPGGPSRRVLLFPGAGHGIKRWPMVKYFELAENLRDTGLEPVFVLGPVERDQGLDTGAWPALAPETTGELMDAMRRSALAVGNDCGPMHLAGALGLPGAALFGPTSARQWGPPGLEHVRGHAPCRPCTRNTIGLDCKNPVCMRSISAARVMRAVSGIMAQK